MSLLVHEQHLAHHGIKGQKWGVRRFQNEDGSYTAAGKERYGIGDGKLKKSINILSDPERFSKSGIAYSKLLKEEADEWKSLNEEYTKKIFPNDDNFEPSKGFDYDLYNNSKEYAKKADALYDKYYSQFDLYDKTVKDIEKSIDTLVNSKEFGDDIKEAKQLLDKLRSYGWDQSEQSYEASRKYFDKIREIGEKAVDEELGKINIEHFIVTPGEYWSGDFTRLDNFVGLLNDYIQDFI